MLVWRFFTYYLFLIVGVGTIILEKIILKREARHKREAEQDGNTDALGGFHEETIPEEQPGEAAPKEPGNDD